MVTPLRKRALKMTIAELEGCTLDQTVAVGDGANDIPMLASAGCARSETKLLSPQRRCRLFEMQ